MRVPQLLLGLVLLPAYSAAIDIIAITNDTPQCALLCTMSTLQEALCPVMNIRECLCKNVDLQKRLATCIMEDCIYSEQQRVTELFQEKICYGIEQESRWPEMAKVLIILSSITYPIIVLRFVSRYFIAHRIWWDDWCIFAATIFLIPLTVLPFLHANQGFGRHFWDIRTSRLTALRKTFYATQLFYVAVLMLTKCSVLFLYLRIFPNKSFQRFVKYCFGFVVLHSVVYLLFLILQCLPISAVWTLEPARRIDLKATVFSGAAITIFEDFFIMCVPVWELQKLALSKRRKAAIVLMFALGGFATITSIVRLRYIAKFSNSVDLTWDNVDVVIWSNIEMFTSTIFPSLISIRPLLTYLIPPCLRNNDAIETLPIQNKGTNTSSQVSKRISAVLPYDFSPKSRKSGHIMIEDQQMGADMDDGSNGKESTGERIGDVWVTNESYVESCVVELGDLLRYKDDLTPHLKADTKIESVTPVSGKMLSRIIEERDLERG